MNRADLYCVWGNTLSPCFHFGDPKQPTPTVLTVEEKDGDGSFLVHFANSGSISALLFFQAIGIPVYRLTTQLRMGNSLFDMVSTIIYKGVPHVYASSCNIANAAFDSERALESYIWEKYPTVSPCPEGKLLPVFIHTPGSRVFTDPATKSKKIRTIANLLYFAVDLFQIQKHKIVIIAPCAVNVDFLDYMLRKKPTYEALKGIPPPLAIDPI
ncbi:hypothetical protein V8C35DRAFT_56004 [Trichoderma chlorosporum]